MSYSGSGLEWFMFIPVVVGLASLCVSATFIWIALTKVRPVNSSAGGLMATGVVLTIVPLVASPLGSYFMGRTLGAAAMMRSTMIFQGAMGIISVAGTAMIVASVAALVEKRGPRDG